MGGRFIEELRAGCRLQRSLALEQAAEGKLEQEAAGTSVFSMAALLKLLLDQRDGLAGFPFALEHSRA
jgi:hypothetical protein